MGKALYRKHRSRSLDEVVGQSHITDTLKSALKKGAIAHAYLFTGPRGVGKTSIARILAHEINNIAYDEDSTHLDIIEIDAASNRRIDEIRDLRDKVHIAPTTSKYKVYIIDEVHMLTREAFNALLKTLEEPPEHAIFILATTELHKVPDTIVSRTQKFNFKPIDPLLAADHLRNIANKESINISDEAIKLVADHGNGSFRDSISILDQLSGLGKNTFGAEDVSFLLGLPDEELINDLLNSIATADEQTMFNSVQGLNEQGVDFSQAVQAISKQLRNDIINNSTRINKSSTIKLLKDLLPLSGGSHSFVALELALLDAMHTDRETNSAPVTAPQPPHAEPVSKPTPKPPKPPRPQEVPKTEQPEDTSKAIPSTNDAPSSQASPKPVKKNGGSSKTVKADAIEPDDQATQETTDDTRDDQQPSNQSGEFSTKKWDELLNDLKGHHNTLYGILRMAEATSQDSLIILTFKFGFHKKRVEDHQSTVTMNKYIKKHFGDMKLECKVNSKAKTKVTTPEKNKQSGTKTADNSVSNVSNIFGGAELLD